MRHLGTAKRAREYRLPSPPLLNVMYCIRVSLKQVKIYIYFYKLTQPLTVSIVHLLYTVNEKGGNPDRKPHPLPYMV